MHHPKTKMAEILKGQDPAIILVNAATSASGLGGAGLAVAAGPVGLVAGRDKAGSAGRKDIVEDLGVKEEGTKVRELEESAASFL